MLDLDKLEAIARAATPGPWTADWPLGGVYRANEPRISVALGVAGTDAAHIAAFDPPTVLALIARVQTLETALAWTRRKWRAAVGRNPDTLMGFPVVPTDTPPPPVPTFAPVRLARDDTPPPVAGAPTTPGAGPEGGDA